MTAAVRPTATGSYTANSTCTTSSDRTGGRGQPAPTPPHQRKRDCNACRNSDRDAGALRPRRRPQHPTATPAATRQRPAAPHGYTGGRRRPRRRRHPTATPAATPTATPVALYARCATQGATATPNDRQQRPRPGAPPLSSARPRLRLPPRPLSCSISTLAPRAHGDNIIIGGLSLTPSPASSHPSGPKGLRRVRRRSCSWALANPTLELHDGKAPS